MLDEGGLCRVGKEPCDRSVCIKRALLAYMSWR